MASPTDRRYTSTHEWVKLDTQTGYYKVGITAFRTSQLGTITSQSFNVANNSDVSATTGVCTVTGSSSNTVHAAMHGTLRNERLLDTPNTIGTDPWGTDLFTVEAANPNDYNSLMTASQYDAMNNA